MVKLSVNKLNFSYENGFSLKDISFSVGKGQLCAVLGPNASGKTTLIKCIANVLQISSGAIRFDEKDMSLLKQNEISKTMAYVPQVHEASFPYSVTDMVLMGRNPYIGYFSMPKSEDLQKSVDALAALKIEQIKNKAYTQISSGQQKLVLIARALAQETPIILLDEPTAHLDFRNKLLVLKNIKNLVKTKQVTVLMSLHDPNEVSLVADQTLIMNGGEIVSNGRTGDVLTVDVIKEIYGVDVGLADSGERKVFVPSMDLIKEDFV
ncbi:MAG: ABC transporter ATP-binding protein [Candidatus Bathyarchaeota archaeon]|nr:ABC transporter ATP-binding protein [Candidatus Bathyarchaeota archaeon]